MPYNVRELCDCAFSYIQWKDKAKRRILQSTPLSAALLSCRSCVCPSLHCIVALYGCVGLQALFIFLRWLLLLQKIKCAFKWAGLFDFGNNFIFHSHNLLIHFSISTAQKTILDIAIVIAISLKVNGSVLKTLLKKGV